MNKDGVVDLVISFLDEKGFGVGILDNYEKVKVTNALPEEVVKVKLWKKRRKVWKADNIEIVYKSQYRVEPKDIGFEATAPWQIMDFGFEMDWKKNFLQNLIQSIGMLDMDLEVATDSVEYGYRNKIEWSFYADDDGLSLAFHKVGTKSGMIKVTQSSLVPDKVNIVSREILNCLRQAGVPKADLKTLQVRYSFLTRTCVATLFVKNIEFDTTTVSGLVDNLKLGLQGLEVVYSEPKSPASVYSQKLASYGDYDISESISGMTLKYPSNGFFQVNPHMFEEVLKDIKDFLGKIGEIDLLVDLYAGVGTIGLGLADVVNKVEGVEIFSDAKVYADNNIELNSLVNVNFEETLAESVLDKVARADCLVVDPPRAGLHPKLNQAILDNPPKVLVYLSCNPKIQVADVDIWKDLYECKLVKGYNFYPKTPHVEMLMCFVRK
jgi:23S rRNA (uracil1939-C5)-methyltransferase